MKKYLCDLTFDERKELISNIDELENVLRDNIQDDAYHWLDEYLEGVPASYQIGSYCQGEHFRLNDDCLSDFEKWYNRVQRDYCFLSPDEEKTAEEYIRIYNLETRLFDMYFYGYDYYNGKPGYVKEEDFYNVW